jgi:hypothetical protein
MSLGFFKRGMQADFEAGHISNVSSETAGENQRKPKKLENYIVYAKSEGEEQIHPSTTYSLHTKERSI